MRDEILRYLHHHHVLTLCTVSGDMPQAAALFYVVGEKGQLYFLSDPASRHARNLQANAHVAVTIQSETADWRNIRGLQIEGTARAVTDIHEIEGALERYLARFPELQDSAEPDDAIAHALKQARWYCVEPCWIRWVDNTRGFGHKEEWTLDDQQRNIGLPNT